jgi:hypothetical protein
MYISLETSPAQTVKIDPGSMTTVNKWTGAPGQDVGYSMTYDGVYLYTGLETDPAQIVRIHPDSMTTVSTYVANAGDKNASSLISDGRGYLYATLYMFPAEVLQIYSGQ